MVVCTTSGIKISVITSFEDVYAKSMHNQYLFSYTVTIENQNDFDVQLLRRHWRIFDASGDYNEVEGLGVIGKQPILSAGEIHQYSSACNLTVEIGKMWGTYLMKKLIDGSTFKVDIPEFKLITPFKMN